jgi:hypothetical protein
MAYTLIGDSGTVTFKPMTGVIDSEGVSIGNKVTSNPIEGGGQINDHASPEPVKLDISGVVTDMPDARATLEAMANNRDLLSYRGAEAYDNLLITSLSISRSKDAGGESGFSFRLSLQQMSIVTAAFVPALGPRMSSDAKTAQTGKPGAKAKTTAGLVAVDTGYAAYVNGFSSPAPQNTDITAAQTNPSYKGY